MTATQHAVETYLPPPEEERKGVALCLSGGGYRAALFHLGALRRLNELGVLTSIDTISSVSGGSVAAAFIAAHAIEHPSDWQTPGTVLADWESGVAEPLRRLARTNIRTGAISLASGRRTGSIPTPAATASRRAWAPRPSPVRSGICRPGRASSSAPPISACAASGSSIPAPTASATIRSATSLPSRRIGPSPVPPPSRPASRSRSRRGG